MDLINDFAFPLPITVISELLGIPVADRQQFRTWTRTLLTSTDRRMQGGEYQEAIVAAQNKFSQYIKALIAEKRAHPGNDLVSSMVKTDENGDTLTEKELISTIFLLIVAGHETTVNLIGNGTLALLQHPDQLHLLQQDPSLVISAIEELLRYTAPVSLSSPRWASEDITIHGKVIKKGEMVFVALAGANTDPGQFEHPNQLNITREEQKHLAFGKGIHFCLGAPLARLEGQIAFNTLLQRFPQLHLDCDPDQLNWVRTPILRGLTSLPVAF
jgi:cytochrome P450 PksS